MCLLLVVKAWYPRWHFLLRGRNEAQSGSGSGGSGFRAACADAFGHEGDQAWRAFRGAFDCMPVAAIVNGAYFCAAGGLASSVGTVEDLERHACLGRRPRPFAIEEGSVLHELVWNSPISDRTAKVSSRRRAMPRVTRRNSVTAAHP